MKKNQWLLFGLIILSVIPFLSLLLRLNWGLLQTNPSAFQTSIVAMLASISGMIATVLFFWQVLIGSRFLISKFTNDTIAINQLHQKIGIYGTILVVLHPVLISLYYPGGLGFVLTPSTATPFDVFVGLGRVGLLLFLIIWVTSALLRSRMKYRPWLYLHYLSYPMMLLVLFHAREVGTYLNSYPLLQLIWNGFVIALIALIIFRLTRFAGFGKPRFILESKKQLSDDVFEYVFTPSSSNIRPKVGQYCYIQQRRFGEAHPFTVMEFDEQTGKLTFGIKASGPYTKKLSTLKKGTQVYLDGPYGVFTLEGQSSEPKVVIAGGIGITPFVELINRYGNDQTYLFYSNQTLKEAVKRDELKEELDGNFIDAVTREEVKQPNIINGRIDAPTIQKFVPKTIFKDANYFICGPKPFYHAISQGLQSLGIPKQNIYFEAFGL